MIDFSSLLLIIFPILLGCVFFFFQKSRRKIKKLLPSFISILCFYSAVITIFFSETPFSTSFSWHPAAGNMGMIFERSPLVLIILISIALFFVVLHDRRHPQMSSSIQTSLMLFSYSFALTALVADHFMLRFVALEFVGLCVVGSVLASPPNSTSNWNNVRNILLNFKFGDLCFLVAIFLMQANSGTFNISQNLELATELSQPNQAIITTCLLAVVWVKLSIWPLDWWVKALSNLPSFLRTWYADLLLPVLGVYLLYRSSPLLNANTNLATFFVILALCAVLIKLLVFKFNKRTLPHQQLIQIFTSICLIPLAALGMQSLLWAFVIFWFIARTAFSTYTLRHEHSPPVSSTCSSSFNFASLFFLHAFSFLALLHTTHSNFLPNLVLIALWTIWWLLFIQNLNQIFVKERNLAGETFLEKNKKALGLTTASLILAVMGTCIAVLVVYILSFYTKGKGIWITAIFIDSNSSLTSAAYGLIPALLLYYPLSLHTEKTRNYLGRLVRPIRVKNPLVWFFRNGQMKDPLNQFPLFSSLFMSAASFLYKTIEQNSIDQIVSIFQKIFSFLFNQIEKLISKELWENTLKTIVNSSRKLQALHPGFLRLNQFWFLLFIIILVLVIFNQSIIYIFPSG